MRRRLSKLPNYISLTVFALFALIPFQYMLATAMTPLSYSMPYPPILVPEKMYFGNFLEAWNANHFSRYFLNSLIVAAIATIIIMLVSSAGAYAFARMHFPGRDFVFYLYLFTMMVPTVTNLIPQFLLMKDLKLVDTYLGLLLPRDAVAFRARRRAIQGPDAGRRGQQRTQSLEHGGGP